MGLEIERKFLVKGDYKTDASKSTRITQGYLSSVPERTVRVRLKGNKGYLTVKGAGNESGASRYEWEKEIPAEEAKELLQLCEPGIIFSKSMNFTGQTPDWYSPKLNWQTKASISNAPHG